MVPLPLDVSLHAFFRPRTHLLTHSHMQRAHGVFNMTSLATLHMCGSILWEDRKASASLCLFNTFSGKLLRRREPPSAQTDIHQHVRITTCADCRLVPDAYILFILSL